jgi:hypothetical protein
MSSREVPVTPAKVAGTPWFAEWEVLDTRFSMVGWAGSPATMGERRNGSPDARFYVGLSPRCAALG